MITQNGFKAICDVLKKKFNNLTVAETVDLAFQIQNAAQTDLESYAHTTTDGSIKVYGTKADIDNLIRLITRLQHGIK